MRLIRHASAIALVTLMGVGAAEARGCIKGAIIGGLAGHYLAERGVVGAVAGCLAGRALANRQARREIDYGASKGLLSTLGDDYTTFLEPVQQQGVREQMSGDYEGVGVYLEAVEGRWVVTSPIKDAPADRLLDAIRVVAAGDALLAPSVTRRIIEQFARPRANPELGARLDDRSGG